MSSKPTSMLTRKRTHLSFVLVSAGLLVCATALVVSPRTSPSTAKPSRTTHATPRTLNWQANPPSPVTVAYPATMEGKALHGGIAYLQNRVTDIPPNERLIIDYLQRRYGLPQILSAAKTPIQLPKYGQQEDTAAFLAVRRFAYPKSLVNTLPDASADPMSQMVLAAANCDHLPLPGNFSDLVKQNIAKGGYSLTHVEFSLQRLAENSCAYFAPDQLAAINARVASGMDTLAGNPGTPADLRYEATAFLLDMGRPDLISQSSIDQLVSEQRPDGGWRKSETIDAGSDHTAMLAVWSLLVWTHQKSTGEPMIHHPT